jgi:hypothetical protein
VFVDINIRNAECKKRTIFLASDHQVRGRTSRAHRLAQWQTVGDWLMPRIDKAYESGKMPPLLPGW